MRAWSHRDWEALGGAKAGEVRQESWEGWHSEWPRPDEAKWGRSNPKAGKACWSLF